MQIGAQFGVVQRSRTGARIGTEVGQARVTGENSSPMFGARTARW